MLNFYLFELTYAACLLITALALLLSRQLAGLVVFVDQPRSFYIRLQAKIIHTHDIII